VCSERNSYLNSGRIDVVNKMMVGPSLALCRQSQQTAPRCWTGDCEVLNGKGKKSC